MTTQELTTTGAVIVGVPMMDATEARSNALSPLMQSIARNYLATRARAGEAILDSARYLAEARQAAKYGEWRMFLEATGTPEDTATRLLAIASRADADQQYAGAVRDGRLAFTAAFELLRAPAEMQQRALDSTAPTPATVIRKAKQETKVRTSAEFEPPPPDLSSFGFSVRWLPGDRVGIRSEGNLETEHTHGQLNDLIAHWRAYPPIPADLAAADVTWRYRQDRMYQVMRGATVGQTGYTADEALRNQRESMQRAGLLAAPIEPPRATGDQALDDQAMIAAIRALAAPLDLQTIWEDGKVLLYWKGEEDEIDQMDFLSYGAAIEWLTWEAKGIKQDMVVIPDAPAAPAKADPALTIEQLDDCMPKNLEAAGYYWKSAQPIVIAHNDGWTGDAATIATAIVLAKTRCDARTEPIAVFPALNQLECKALIREAQQFIASGLDRKLPTIGQALRIAAWMALEATE